MLVDISLINTISQGGIVLYNSYYVAGKVLASYRPLAAEGATSSNLKDGCIRFVHRKFNIRTNSCSSYNKLSVRS